MPDEHNAVVPRPVSKKSPRLHVSFVRRWLAPAILVSTALAIIGLAINFSQIESDLQQRVSARLEQAGLTWVTVEMDGRAALLTGTSPTSVQQLEAREAAAAVWGVATVRDRTNLIPLVTPFNWTVERDGGFVILSGYLPSEDIQGSVRGLVEAILPGASVDDRTALARGAPPDFQQGIEFALRVVANLTIGRVELEGVNVSAEGRAIDILRYESAIEIAESGLPPGFVVARADILPPLAVPYFWSITISEAVAVIAGSVPSDEVAADLRAATQAAFGGAVLNDLTALASGAPVDFELMVNRALLIGSLLGDGEVKLTDSELSVSGRARSPETYEALLALLVEEQPGAMTIAYQDVAPSVAEAYVLEVVRSGDGVELIGFMPNEDARAEVLAEAGLLFGEGGVQDRLQIAGGAPRMDWIGAGKFALAQVAALSGGSARISDHSYSITGAAATSESYEMLRAALEGTLPASLVLNNVLLSAPVESPYRFTAAVGPEAITLTGAVPSPEARELFTTETGLRFSPMGIANETRLASGAPVGFEDAVVAGLQAISRLVAGRFELVDLSISITGIAPHQGAITRIEDQLRDSVPGGFSVAANLNATLAQSLVTPETCQDLLIAELGQAGIKFSEGSAAIAPESEGRLDRLVAILERCPEAGVEIGGHTDSAGTTSRNAALSQIRAEAVVEYLQQAGIAADRLTAVGYGETVPIANNETEEGRALNRRIEFTIAVP